MWTLAAGWPATVVTHCREEWPYHHQHRLHPFGQSEKCGVDVEGLWALAKMMACPQLF